MSLSALTPIATALIDSIELVLLYSNPHRICVSFTRATNWGLTGVDAARQGQLTDDPLHVRGQLLYAVILDMFASISFITELGLGGPWMFAFDVWVLGSSLGSVGGCT